MMVAKDDGWLAKIAEARRGPWTTELSRCLACSALGTCRFGVLTETVSSDGVLRADVRLGKEHEGGPDVVHGGSLCGILDEVMGHAVMSRGIMVVTSSLTVDFLKPVPILVPLLAHARVVGADGRRFTVEGELELPNTGQTLARGRGTWVGVPDEHYARHRGWLDGVTAASQSSALHNETVVRAQSGQA
jgi:uncharacterized protein (TIGR00369 family)